MNLIEKHSEKTQFLSRLATNMILEAYVSVPSYSRAVLHRNSDGTLVMFSPELSSPVDGSPVLGYMQVCENEQRIFLSEELTEESVSYEVLKDVVLHEYAHFLDYAFNGRTGHGTSFKEMCKKVGTTNDGVYLNTNTVERSHTVFNKIKKLLALSESANKNEAEAALSKAKALMAKYGIENSQNESTSIYRVCLDEFNVFSTEIQTLVSITADISNCWMLHSNNAYYASKKFSVFAHGSETECKIASYIYDYLKKELKEQYKALKKDSYFGRASKKSFYIGAALSLKERFSKETDEETTKALVAVREDTSLKAKSILYSSEILGVKKMDRTVTNFQSFTSGRKAGRNIQIRQGIDESNQNEQLYLN